MTEHDIRLVRESWNWVAARADEAAAEFYVALFSESPGLMPVFAGPDMEVRGRRLVRAVDRVIRSLDQGPRILPVVERFARRYAAATAERRHLEVAWAALQSTLESALGSSFTDAHRSAWRCVFGELASVAQQAAWEVYAA